MNFKYALELLSCEKRELEDVLNKVPSGEFPEGHSCQVEGQITELNEAIRILKEIEKGGKIAEEREKEMAKKVRHSLAEELLKRREEENKEEKDKEVK